MGMPIPNNPQQHARLLVERKDEIQAELNKHLFILGQNESTMSSPLLDPHGFPRADIDIVSVRNARVKIIELRNDLSAIMDEIAQVLEKVYQRDESEPAPATISSAKPSNTGDASTPFALVNGVAPSSPASQAGLQRGDKILKFGSLTISSFDSPTSLQPISSFVTSHENRPIQVVVQRNHTTTSLTLTPRAGWGGRGLLGCHIVPLA